MHPRVRHHLLDFASVNAYAFFYYQRINEKNDRIGYPWRQANKRNNSKQKYDEHTQSGNDGTFNEPRPYHS